MENDKNLESFGQHLKNQLNETLMLIYKQVAYKRLKIASSVGVSFLITHKFIVPILLHDTFVIINWGKIIIFYFIVFILSFIIYSLTEVFLKFLLYIFR